MAPIFVARQWALLAMSVGVFCIQLDAFALNLALPQIGRDLHPDSGGLQWVVSAYLLSTGTLMLGAGRLGDLFGDGVCSCWGWPFSGRRPWCARSLRRCPS